MHKLVRAIRDNFVRLSLGAAILSTPHAAFGYAGEDALAGKPFHHYDITLRALAGDQAIEDAFVAHRQAGKQFGVNIGEVLGGGTMFPGIGFSPDAASAIAWHADYIDSYLYSPIWWAQGLVDEDDLSKKTTRLKASLAQFDHLAKLHFDDTFTTAGVNDTWKRYGAGTLAGLQWAAENNDVAAAHNILGVSVHAVQDFYSHTNWVNAPENRTKTWMEYTPSERASKRLFSGAYELPETSAPHHHSKISLPCTIYGRKDVPMLQEASEMVCHGLSPYSDSNFCVEYRQCRTNDSATTISVAGLDATNALVLNPPGIALDSTWLARSNGPQRGLTNKAGAFLSGKDANWVTMDQCTAITSSGLSCKSDNSGKFMCDAPEEDIKKCTTDAERMFATSKYLAMEATAQWVARIDAIMTANHKDFWNRVKNPNLQLMNIKQRTSQFEDFAQAPFQFLSTGPYPVANANTPGRQFEQTSDGYYLRLRIKTADEQGAGTDADVRAVVTSADGSVSSFHLDYMPLTGDNISSASALGRALSYNDFERGDDNVYTIGPIASPPTNVALLNDAADTGDAFEAAGEDIASYFEDAIEGRLERLNLFDEDADRVGTDIVRLTPAEIGASKTGVLEINGGSEGHYKLSFSVTASTDGLTQAQINAGTRTYVFIPIMYTAVKESDADQGSNSDEPFFFLSVTPLSDAPGKAQFANFGPFEDVDTGEQIPVARAFKPVTLTKNGTLVLGMSQFESDYESPERRKELFDGFVMGHEEDAIPRFAKTLNAAGSAAGSAWTVAGVDVYGFRRGDQVEAGEIGKSNRKTVVEGGESLSIALNTGKMKTIAAANSPSSPSQWYTTQRFASLEGGAVAADTSLLMPPDGVPMTGLITDGTYFWVMNGDGSRSWLQSAPACRNAATRLSTELINQIPKRHSGEGAYTLGSADSGNICGNPGGIPAEIVKNGYYWLVNSDGSRNYLGSGASADCKAKARAVSNIDQYPKRHNGDGAAGYELKGADLVRACAVEPPAVKQAAAQPTPPPAAPAAPAPQPAATTPSGGIPKTGLITDGGYYWVLNGDGSRNWLASTPPCSTAAKRFPRASIDAIPKRHSGEGGYTLNSNAFAKVCEQPAGRTAQLFTDGSNYWLVNSDGTRNWLSGSVPAACKEKAQPSANIGAFPKRHGGGNDAGYALKGEDIARACAAL